MAELISMRIAYGQALVELGKNNPDVVVLSADVCNSSRRMDRDWADAASSHRARYRRKRATIVRCKLSSCQINHERGACFSLGANIVTLSLSKRDGSRKAPSWAKNAPFDGLRTLHLHIVPSPSAVFGSCPRTEMRPRERARLCLGQKPVTAKCAGLLPKQAS